MGGITFQRACVWSGLVCITLFVGGFAFAGFIPPVKPHDSAIEIARHYREHTTGIRFGGLLLILAGMFYAAYTAVISSQMRRIPGVHHAVYSTQLCAGAFGCLTYLVPGLTLEVAVFRPDRDPELTLLLNDMFWIFAVMPWTPFLTQNWAFAYAILSDRRAAPLFPRWLAYVNVWAPLIFSPSVLLPFFKSGAFSWAGIFVLWIPAVVFIAQFGCNCWCLHRAVGDEARAPATA